MMLAAVKSLAAGRPPHGQQAAHAYRLRSGDTVARRDADITDVLDARFGEQWGIGARRPQ